MNIIKLKYLILSLIFTFSLFSCSSNEDEKYKIKELEDRISELESELEDAQYTMEEAQYTIQEYEDKLDNIQFQARQGYNAISFFNWSFELQEALDAFERIEYEANY